MSVSMYESSVRQYTKELADLELKLTQEKRAEGEKNEKRNKAMSAANKATTFATRDSKTKEALRHQKDVSASLKKQESIGRSIATKRASLDRAKTSLQKAQQAEMKRDKSKTDEAERQRQQAELSHHRRITQELALQHRLMRENAQLATPRVAATERAALDAPSFDVFISHASEDKEDLVRPLAIELKDRGLSVWYDEASLKIGDSLRRKIDEGLRHSRFGVVVISPSFIKKDWPRYELDGLVARETDGQDAKVILPIWHKVSKDEVIGFSPTLAMKLALNTTVYSIEEIATQLVEVIRPRDETDAEDPQE